MKREVYNVQKNGTQYKFVFCFICRPTVLNEQSLEIQPISMELQNIKFEPRKLISKLSHTANLEQP